MRPRVPRAPKPAWMRLSVGSARPWRVVLGSCGRPAGLVGCHMLEHAAPPCSAPLQARSCLSICGENHFSFRCRTWQVCKLDQTKRVKVEFV